MTLSRWIKSKWFFVIVSLVMVLSLVAVGVGGWGGTHAVAATNDQSSFIPPDRPGPHHIGYYSTKYAMKPYGVYYATIYYPARRDGWLAAKDASAAPYPGIVVANGGFGSDWNITWIPRQLASHGYVALCFTPPAGGTFNNLTIAGFIQMMDPGQWAEGIKGGIDKLKEQNSLAASPFVGLLDVDTFGAIGLSMGGAGCLEATGTNPEVDAAVSLAAGDDNAIKNIRVPTQLQVGSNDAFVRLRSILGGAQQNPVQAAYKDIPDTTKKEFLEIKGGSHVAFIDSWVAPIANLMEKALGGGYKIPVEEQHRISERYFVSWFNYFLKGQTGYGTYIFGPEAQKDVSSGVLSQLRTNVS